MPQIPTGQGPSPMPLGYTEGPGGIHGTDNLGSPIDTRPGQQEDEVAQLLYLRDQIDQRLSEMGVPVEAMSAMEATSLSDAMSASEPMSPSAPMAPPSGLLGAGPY